MVDVLGCKTNQGHHQSPCLWQGSVTLAGISALYAIYLRIRTDLLIFNQCAIYDWKQSTANR